MIKSRKAQSQLITTVLIILLVLAAVIIVWQLTQRTVSGGADQVDKQAACIGLGLTVESAKDQSLSSFSLAIKRGVDDLGSGNVTVSAVSVNGLGASGSGNSPIAAGEIKTIAVTRLTGERYDPGNELIISMTFNSNDGTVCDAGTQTVTLD